MKARALLRRVMHYMYMYALCVYCRVHRKLYVTQKLVAVIVGFNTSCW